MRHNLQVILTYLKLQLAFDLEALTMTRLRKAVRKGGARRSYILELSTVENADDHRLTHYFLLKGPTPTGATRAYTWTSSLSH